MFNPPQWVGAQSNFSPAIVRSERVPGSLPSLSTDPPIAQRGKKSFFDILELGGNLLEDYNIAAWSNEAKHDDNQNYCDTVERFSITITIVRPGPESGDQSLGFVLLTHAASHIYPKPYEAPNALC